MNKIKINPKNKGKFNATKKATGKTTEELTHSKNPITKKRAIFAQNAAKWNKKALGGDVTDPFMEDFLSKRIENRQNNAWVGLNNEELPTNDLSTINLSRVGNVLPPIPVDNDMDNFTPIVNTPANKFGKFKTKPLPTLTTPELNLSGYSETNNLPGYKNENSFKIKPQTLSTTKDTYWQDTNTKKPKVNFSVNEDWVNKAPHISPMWNNPYLNRATYHFNNGNDALFKGLGKVLPKADGGIRVNPEQQGSFFTPSNFNLLPLDPNITNAPDNNVTYVQPDNLTSDNTKLQTAPELNLESPYTPNSTLNSFNNYSTVGTFAKAGAEHALAGINAAKGIVDTIGDMRMNNFTKKRELDTYKQSVFSDATNVRPYETQGYNWRGRNQLFELGGDVSIDKYNTDSNGLTPIIEAEKGELAKTPDGLIDVINSGEKHSNGGTPMNLPNNSVILSEKLKIKTPKGKKSFTDLGKPYQTEKELKLLKNNKVDSLTKNYAAEAINMKKQKIDEIFQLQESLKEQGYFGKDIQLQTIDEKLPKAEDGAEVEALKKKNFKVGTDVLGSGKAPNTYQEWAKFYKNLEEYRNYLGLPKKDYSKLSHLDYQKDVSELAKDQLLNLIREDKMGITNKGRGILKSLGINREIAKFSDLNEKERNLISSKYQDMDNFLVDQYQDDLRGHRGVLFQPEDITPEEATKRYKKSEFSTLDFDPNTDEKTMLFNYKQDDVNHIFHYPTKKRLPTQPNPANPPQEKIVFKDRPVKEYVNVPGNTNYNIDIPNLNVPLGFPMPYGRTPLNYYKVEPNYIDPRYLDVQPQLNEINRVVRTFQTNLGDRTSANKSNALQSQVNAYNKENQVFGQKYNYDRSQDAQAQQFNAQAKTNIDQFNEQTWYNQLENPIRMRESVIADQILTDLNKGNERYLKENQFYNNKNYIDNLLTSEFNPEDLTKVLTLGTQALQEEKKKTTTKQKSDGTTETTTTTVPKDKYGGKIKIKPKIKKS